MDMDVLGLSLALMRRKKQELLHGTKCAFEVEQLRKLISFPFALG